MPVRIFTPIPSLNAQRILGIDNDRLARSPRLKPGFFGFAAAWRQYSPPSTVDALVFRLLLKN